VWAVFITVEEAGMKRTVKVFLFDLPLIDMACPIHKSELSTFF